MKLSNSSLLSIVNASKRGLIMFMDVLHLDGVIIDITCEYETIDTQLII